MGCELLLHIPTLANAPSWQEMTVEKEGLNEWEAGQVAAFDVLQKICQEHAEEIGMTAMQFFPPSDLSNASWGQRSMALTDEGQPSHSPTLTVIASANLALTKMHHAREETRKYWRRMYNLCNIELKVTDNLWETSKSATHQVMDYANKHELEMDCQYNHLWIQAILVEQQRVQAVERATAAEAAKDEAVAEAIETMENAKFAEHTLQQEVEDANVIIANLQQQINALQIGAPPEEPENGAVVDEEWENMMDPDDEEEPEELELIPDDQTETDLDDDYPIDSEDEF